MTSLQRLHEHARYASETGVPCCVSLFGALGQLHERDAPLQPLINERASHNPQFEQSEAHTTAYPTQRRSVGTSLAAAW